MAPSIIQSDASCRDRPTMRVDLARRAHACQDGDILRTMTLDFEDAFMSTPLQGSERSLSCVRTAEGLRRSRKSLRPDEPEVGEVFVRRVLGFGGRPNPIMSSRTASLLPPAPRRRSSKSRRAPRAISSCTSSTRSSQQPASWSQSRPPWLLSRSDGSGWTSRSKEAARC